MFITKAEPSITRNGAIKDGIKIENNILYLDNGKLLYRDKKWYILGYDGKEYYLGVGANPCYTTTKDDVLDEELFDCVFEEVPDNPN